MINGLLAVSPTNSRYLVGESGEPVLLVGFHTWSNVQDGDSSSPPDEFDWADYLNALVSRGLNFTKLWTMETVRGWSHDSNYWFAPPRYERTGPGNANDGGLKFDLDQINEDWLNRLYERALACQNEGIYVCVQLFQGWQIENKGWAGDPWAYHPYNSANNINGVNGDPNSDGQGTETQLLSGNPVLAYQEALIEAVIDRLNGLDNIIWEVSNEPTGSTGNTAWQEHIMDHVRAYEATLPKQHLIGFTKQYPSASSLAIKNSSADWGSYDVDYADAIWDGSGPVSIYDTDHTVGLTSEYVWMWQGLCNGHGGLWYMDEWDGQSAYGWDRRTNPTYVLIRDNLGYALAFARSLRNIELMTPSGGLSTTGYCLARNHATQAEYVVFQPGSGAFTLNLTTATGTLNVTWLRCSTGETSTDTVAGGDGRTLTPPWSGPVVAYVRHG